MPSLVQGDGSLEPILLGLTQENRPPEPIILIRALRFSDSLVQTSCLFIESSLYSLYSCSNFSFVLFSQKSSSTRQAWER